MNKTLTRTGGVSCGRHFSLTPPIWAVLFILVVPLIFVAYYAFTDATLPVHDGERPRVLLHRDLVVDDGEAVREVRTYLLIFWRSLKLAVISTAICLVLAYPHGLHHGARPSPAPKRCSSPSS